VLKFIINAISNGLAFSRSEAKGTFILVVLSISALFFSRLLSSKIKNQPTPVYDTEKLVKWVSEVESSYEKEKKSTNYVSKKYTAKTYVDEKKSEDLQPMVPKENEVKIYDLNRASEIDLQKIKGIGKAYSARIVKFRDLLGGFNSVDQLDEVYGITDDLKEKISQRFSIQTSNSFVPINSDSVKTLIKHPYISCYLAWVIINYRKQNGDIERFEDLEKIKAINDSILQKLKPYIK
jgi:DNA uptake protein ComE-like DNA-binding protein